MGRWIMEMLGSMGYTGVVVLMFAENIVPPIPSEFIMPLSGYLASQDVFTLLGVSLAGTLGAFLGALALYWLGRATGQERLERLSARYGRWLTVSPQDVDRATRWFRRHGAAAVLLGRLVPGVRSLISIPAGVARMPFGVFVVCTLIGSAIWSALLAGVGYYLGSNFERVHAYLDPVSTVVLGGLLAVYAVRVIRFRRA